MKIKNALLAGILVAGFPVAVQAQEVENYEEYQVGCEAGVNCNDFDVNYGQQPENDAVSQRTRTRRTRSRGSDKKLYFGATAGVAFLGDGAETGFGGSILGGYNFSDRYGAELEIFDYFGGIEDASDDFDSGYSYLGIAANFASKYPFNKRNPRSLYGLAGVGLGYGRLGFTGDLGDALEDADVDSSYSGFLFNAKLGLGFPVSDSLDIIGQARYANMLLEDIDDVSVEQDAITLDLGARINF